MHRDIQPAHVNMHAAGFLIANQIGGGCGDITDKTTQEIDDGFEFIQQDGFDGFINTDGVEG